MFDLYLFHPKIIRAFDFSSLPAYGIHYSPMFRAMISWRSRLEITATAPYITRHFSLGDLWGMEFPRDVKKLLSSPVYHGEIAVDPREKRGTLPGTTPAQPRHQPGTAPVEAR